MICMVRDLLKFFLSPPILILSILLLIMDIGSGRIFSLIFYIAFIALLIFIQNKQDEKEMDEYEETKESFYLGTFEEENEPVDQREFYRR